MIEEPANVQAGGVADEDPALQSWYLAHDDRSKLLWIHTRGARTSSNGDPILHKGRELRSYPSLRCYVFARTACEYQEGDPVAQDWIRLDNLEGRSAFVGINYPFLLKPPANPKPAADDTEEALRVFTPDCVFATHVRGQHRPQPVPDWSRMHINGGAAALGSILNYEEAEHRERMFEAPMWFIPARPTILGMWAGFPG